MNWLIIAQFALSTALGGLSGGVIALIGVWGAEKHQNRRLTELELDLEQVRMHQKSFQKTVSGKFGAEERTTRLSIEKEAQQHLGANKGSSSDQDWIENK